MKVTFIAFCMIACVFVSGCASAPLVDQAESTAGFDTVQEALSFIVGCVDQNDARRLTAACVGRGAMAPLLATTSHTFNNLVSFNKTKGLMKSYGDKTFPAQGVVFKLGGHGKQFQHLHIDFVKKDQKWYLADIWNCR